LKPTRVNGPKLPKENTYILEETETQVVLLSGFTKKSGNGKTGDMLQSYILARNIHPVELVKSKQDAIVCFDCPLKSGNGCHEAPLLGKAPTSMWRKYRRGGYSRLIDLSLLRGKKIRFGVYGEPTLIPIEIVRAMASVSVDWLGYTHRWKEEKIQPYKDFFMASTSPSDSWLARAKGWRDFEISDSPVSGKVLCPASELAKKERESRGIHKDVSCATCGLCSGNLTNSARGALVPFTAKSVWNPVHSTVAKKARVALGIN